MIIGISALTLSLPLQFTDHTSLLLWLVELPSLLMVGYYFRQPFYRWCAYVLTTIGFFQYLSVSSYEVRHLQYDMFFIILSWHDLMLLISSFVFAGMFFICYKNKKYEESIDKGFNHVFSALSVVSINWFLCNQYNSYTLGNLFAFEALIVCATGYLTKLRRFSHYGYLFLVVVMFKFLIDRYNVSTFMQGVLSVFQISIFYILYFYAKFSSEQNKEKSMLLPEQYLLFIGGTVMFLIALYRFMDPIWWSLAMGLGSVVLLGLGLKINDKTIRWCGLAVLCFTLLRVIFVDLAQLEMLIKIISFIILGILFLGASFVYNKMEIVNDSKK